MKKMIALGLLAGLLTGCVQALPPSAYQVANPGYYNDLPDRYFLKGKISIDRVTNKFAQKDMVTGPNYKLAMERIFREAGLLTGGYKPAYFLNIDIMDYRWTSFGFTHVTAGAAVTYTLYDGATEKEVFSATITSTQEEKKMILEDAAPYRIKSLAVALGENGAEAVQEFSNLTPADLGITKTVSDKHKKKHKQGD